MRLVKTVALCALSLLPAHSQNCVAPTTGQLVKENIIPAGTLFGPVSFSMLPDGTTFFSEMWTGRVRRFIPGDVVVTLDSLTVYTDNLVSNPLTQRGVENGLLGVVVDPNFATNSWIYVLHSRVIPGSNYSAGDNNISPHEHVLARFTVQGDTLANRKNLLTIPRLTARHAAGGLKFDPRTRDLYISTGDDIYPSNPATHYGGRNVATAHYDVLATSANTNDLRGKVLRIRPISFADNVTPAIGVGTTYTIPSGNLFPVGTTRTRPEIYTMGHRNPYHFSLDTLTNWVLIGEVGPDAAADDPLRGMRGHDEFNLVKSPGNYGWPFLIANSVPYIAIAGEPYPVGTVFNPNSLDNLSARNTGITRLPPARGALAWYTADGAQAAPMNVFGGGGEAAISGVLYRYNANQGAGRWPAYYNGKYIVGDYSRQRMWAIELNSADVVTKVEVIPISSRFIDIQPGNDGKIYVLDYTTGEFFRIRYTGTQYDPSQCTHYVPGVTSTSVHDRAFASLSPKLNSLVFGNARINLSGKSRVRIYSLAGKLLATANVPANGIFDSSPHAGSHKLVYLVAE